jgi:hypothetical protein
MFTGWHNRRDATDNRIPQRTIVETLVDYVDSIVGVEVLLSTLQSCRELSTDEPETREGA